MISTRSALRSTTLILSSTLLAIAAEPLPPAVSLAGIKPGYSSQAANVSYGDVDGDGFVDLGIGNIIYWGSATGWKSSAKFQTALASLWIVPNITGAGLDGKIRADLVTIDGNGARSLVQVLSTTTQTTLNSSGSKLNLSGLIGAPAVGDFGGSSLNDIAWIDTANYGTLKLSTNTAGVLSAPASQLVGNSSDPTNASYTAVSAIDWTGSGTGQLDLLLITEVANQTPVAQLFAHAQDITTQAAFTINLGGNYSAVFNPVITIGDINGDGKGDALVTNRDSNALTYIIKSTGSLSTAPSTSFNKFKSGSQGWIVPDVTGDGIDDVAVYASNTPIGGGIVHGGSDITTVLGDVGGIAIDRTIPGDGEGGFLYRFGFFGGFASPRPTAVAYAVDASPWDRHLVLVDQSGYGETSVLPILSPTIVATVQDLSGSGALAIVDSLVTIDFPTTNGSITGLVVSVSGASAGDVISDAAPVPGTITAIDLPLSNGSLTRTYNGTMTVAQATGVLKNLRFTAAQGGAVRSAFVVLLGQADANDTGPRAESYFSAKFQAATLTAPGLAFTAITGAKVGGTVISEVRGGNGTYTVTVDGGVGFAGGSPDNVRAVSGPATNVFVTPTRSGTITVTVTDSAGLRGSFTFTATDLPTASEPAPLVTPSLGAVTVFGAICPGTVGGVQSLRTAFGSADNRRARGFTWDSARQTYNELPGEPTGGLLPTDGVFLATRVDLGLDFSGPAMPPGSTIVLRAGWNFVGLGPVQLTSGSVVRTHSLADDFTLTNLSGATQPLSQITAAYLWDGSTYSTTTVLQSGIGYWIRNVSSPAESVILTRKDSDMDGRAVRAAGASTFARDAGAPPTPPANGAQASSGPDAESGGCGAGSGIAIALAGLMAFLRLGLRRAK